MSNPSKFIGKLFTASIGEPWDFTSKAGRNLLTGRIIDVIDDVLLCEVSPFEDKGITIDQVAAVNRYVGSQDFLDSALDKKNTTANFMYPCDGHHFSRESAIEELEADQGITFLVGSLKID
ncbi:MAG: hypothetical protein Q8R92_18210 [Deltaproteobacteria bacterium]|nr:hypothetical protein [Deltaproteobacteria bacterium]